MGGRLPSLDLAFLLLARRLWLEAMYRIVSCAWQGELMTGGGGDALGATALTT